MNSDKRREEPRHERTFRLPHNPAEDIQHLELTEPRDKVTRRSGEVVFPRHEAEKYESVESAIDALKARQEAVMRAVANPEGVMPKLAAATEHYKVSKAVTDGNVASVEAVTGNDRVTAAEYKDKVKGFKTKRRERLVTFVGEKAKDVAEGTIDVAGKSIPVLKKLGEGAIDLAKYGFKTIGDLVVIGVDVVRRIAKGKKPEDNQEKNG